MEQLDKNDLWIARISAIGAAQSRYLWLLLALGIFFLSLKPSLDFPSFEVPGMGFPIDVNILEAAGPIVLSTLVILVHGTMRAHGGALRDLGFERDADTPLPKDHQRLAEALDSSPNPLDFSVYTWEKWERLPHVLMLLNYPVYLGIFVAEALYLWSRLVFTTSPPHDVIILVVIGGLTSLAAAIQTIQLGWIRSRRIRGILKRASQPRAGA